MKAIKEALLETKELNSPKKSEQSSIDDDGDGETEDIKTAALLSVQGNMDEVSVIGKVMKAN